MSLVGSPFNCLTFSSCCTCPSMVLWAQCCLNCYGYGEYDWNLLIHHLQYLPVKSLILYVVISFLQGLFLDLILTGNSVTKSDYSLDNVSGCLDEGCAVLHSHIFGYNSNDDFFHWCHSSYSL